MKIFSSFLTYKTLKVITTSVPGMPRESVSNHLWTRAISPSTLTSLRLKRLSKSFKENAQACKMNMKPLNPKKEDNIWVKAWMASTWMVKWGTHSGWNQSNPTSLTLLIFQIRTWLKRVIVEASSIILLWAYKNNIEFLRTSKLFTTHRILSKFGTKTIHSCQ